MKQQFMTTSHVIYDTNGIQDFVTCCIKCWEHTTFDLQGTIWLSTTFKSSSIRGCRVMQRPVMYAPG